METETLAGLALAMLVLLALVFVASRVTPRLRRDLPYCMEHDPTSSWGDHQAGECICAPRPRAARKIR